MNLIPISEYGQSTFASFGDGVSQWTSFGSDCVSRLFQIARRAAASVSARDYYRPFVSFENRTIIISTRGLQVLAYDSSLGCLKCLL
jgi:hypothetical protein